MKAEWPASWSEERRQSFAKRIAVFGVHSAETMPVLAANLETLGAGEQDLVDYLLLARVCQERLAKTEADFQSRVRWSVVLMEKFHISIRDSWYLAIMKMMVVLVLSIPVLVLTLPLRVHARRKASKIVRGFPRTFGEFVSNRRVSR